MSPRAGVTRRGHVAPGRDSVARCLGWRAPRCRPQTAERGGSESHAHCLLSSGRTGVFLHVHREAEGLLPAPGQTPALSRGATKAALAGPRGPLIRFGGGDSVSRRSAGVGTPTQCLARALTCARNPHGCLEWRVGSVRELAGFGGQRAGVGSQGCEGRVRGAGPGRSGARPPAELGLWGEWARGTWRVFHARPPSLCIPGDTPPPTTHGAGMGRKPGLGGAVLRAPGLWSRGHPGPVSSSHKAPAVPCSRARAHPVSGPRAHPGCQAPAPRIPAWGRLQGLALAPPAPPFEPRPPGGCRCLSLLPPQCLGV